jgi:hypothetical protein
LKTCLSGVIRGGEFESVVGFFLKLIGRLGNKTNRCRERKVHHTRLSQGSLHRLPVKLETSVTDRTTNRSEILEVFFFGGKSIKAIDVSQCNI